MNSPKRRKRRQHRRMQRRQHRRMQRRQGGKRHRKHKRQMRLQIRNTILDLWCTLPQHSVEKIGKLNVPFIFSTIGVNLSDRIEKVEFSNIAVDDRAESEKMTEYLLGLGHREIALITERSERPLGRLRMEGYREAYAKRKIPVSENLICYVQEEIEHYSMENGYLTAKKLLESGEKVTAIYAVSDSLAIGACRAVLEAGKRIPEDISVAGYDGIEMGEYYNPKLTTIKQPVEEIAKRTIRLLLDVIAGRREHQQIIFPAELVVRESTGNYQQ